ncbi:MAG: acyl-CoA dehydrogenase, partial [Corynebacterium variabile]
MTTFSPTPTDADLTARFRPVLDSIAHGAVDRDRNRELPREQIRLLRDAGFTALRVHFFTVEGFLAGGDAEGLRRAVDSWPTGTAATDRHR